MSGSLLYDVYVVAQAVNTMFEVVLVDAPLTPSGYAVYSYLAEHPASTPTDMAHALGWPMQTASDWIASMTEQGHLQRTANPADGRSYFISLSASGHQAHESTREAFEIANRRFLNALPTPARQMRQHLREITEAAMASARANALR